MECSPTHALEYAVHIGDILAFKRLLSHKDVVVTRKALATIIQKGWPCVVKLFLQHPTAVINDDILLNVDDKNSCWPLLMGHHTIKVTPRLLYFLLRGKKYRAAEHVSKHPTCPAVESLEEICNFLHVDSGYRNCIAVLVAKIATSKIPYPELKIPLRYPNLMMKEVENVRKIISYIEGGEDSLCVLMLKQVILEDTLLRARVLEAVMRDMEED